jgi:hypothetical protein
MPDEFEGMERHVFGVDWVQTGRIGGICDSEIVSGRDDSMKKFSYTGPIADGDIVVELDDTTDASLIQILIGEV